MSNNVQMPRARHRDWWIFFNNFLKRPTQVAYLFPSSRFIEYRIAKAANLRQAKYIVELGPGTGGTTQSILRNMGEQAELLVIEINKDFCHHIKKHIKDPRLKIFNGGAEDMEVAMRELGWRHADVVLSGIPFSSIKRQIGRKIIQTIHKLLAKDGRFVAYQLRDTVKKLGTEIMGVPITEIEPRNLPPMKIFTWLKK